MRLKTTLYFLYIVPGTRQMVTRWSSPEKRNCQLWFKLEKLLKGKWEFSFKIVVSMCEWVLNSPKRRGWEKEKHKKIICRVKMIGLFLWNLLKTSISCLCIFVQVEIINLFFFSLSLVFLINTLEGVNWTDRFDYSKWSVSFFISLWHKTWHRCTTNEAHLLLHF